MEKRSPKNAVMIVQELCVKGGKVPEYSEIVLPNQVPPVFRTTCTMTFEGKTYSAVADANSKKGAKTKACEDLVYHKLIQVLDMNDPSTKRILGIIDRGEEAVVATIADQKTESAGPSPSKVTKFNDAEETVDLVVDMLSEYAEKGNPIGDLAAFCDLNKLPEPEYLEGPCCGPPHRRILSMECTIGKLKFRGIHLDKKKAKRIVAEKMTLELRKKFESGQILCPEMKPSAESASSEKDLPLDEELINLSLEDIKINRKKTYKDFMNYSSMENMKVNEFEELRQIGGPYFQKLVDFTIEINEKYPVVGQPEQQYKEWLELKTSHDNGIVGFFEAIEKELGLLVTTHVKSLVNEDGETETGSLDEDSEDETFERFEFDDDFKMEKFDDYNDEPDEFEMASDKDSKRQKESNDEETMSPIVPRFMIVYRVEIPLTRVRETSVIKFNDDIELGKLNAMVEVLMHLGLMTMG
ncbi:uncharacterized protein LOC118436013 [Folsomia candida]|uniref:Double-stranded RNA-binding protein Staufen 2 n=1 Tax=Folsomia candida TaxID=158441 RepID=A0A226E6S1_FOLCA|nr:uncharacterized protein LOC118436013 [Folsomia candida]OXA53020.1 Double-stranded RNA-binding protein Staufen 2 [Folsomia candida]